MQSNVPIMTRVASAETNKDKEMKDNFRGKEEKKRRFLGTGDAVESYSERAIQKKKKHVLRKGIKGKGKAR